MMAAGHDYRGKLFSLFILTFDKISRQLVILSQEFLGVLLDVMLVNSQFLFAIFKKRGQIQLAVNLYLVLCILIHRNQLAILKYPTVKVLQFNIIHDAYPRRKIIGPARVDPHRRRSGYPQTFAFFPGPVPEIGARCGAVIAHPGPFSSEPVSNVDVVLRLELAKPFSYPLAKFPAVRILLCLVDKESHSVMQSAFSRELTMIDHVFFRVAIIQTVIVA